MGKRLVKRIGIDLDNTIVDYMAAAGPALKNLLGIEPKNLSSSWTIEDAFGLSTVQPTRTGSKWEYLGVDPTDQEKIEKIRHVLYVENRLFRDMPPLEPSIEDFIINLWQMNYLIYIITARTPHPIIVEDTYEWLTRNGIKPYYTDVVFTNNKADFCKTMGIPIIVEDERMQITNCLMAGIDVIGKSQPWNEEINFAGCKAEGYGRYFRANVWQEMIKLVKEIE